jgi:hypothetical protein
MVLDLQETPIPSVGESLSVSRGADYLWLSIEIGTNTAQNVGLKTEAVKQLRSLCDQFLEKGDT